MDRWQGKVVLVTGASSGIGAATVVELANQGMIVIGVARRVERIEELMSKVTGTGELHAFKADVSKEEDVQATFDFIRSRFGIIHALVNNAGVLRMGHLIDQSLTYLREVVDINLMGTVMCAQQAIKLMNENSIDDGHIININSVGGHVVFNLPGVDKMDGIYPATKFAITAYSETLRHELRLLKSHIKVTSLSPGYVETEVVEAGWAGVGVKLEDLGNVEQAGWPGIKSEDIAEAIVYVLSTGPNVHVSELTVRALLEPF